MNKLLVILCATLFVSCNMKDGVTLSGKIYNSDAQNNSNAHLAREIYLERLDLNTTQIVDSTKISDDGTFTLRADAVSEPTFFRATLSNGKSLIFVADSTEIVEVTADNNNWQQSLSFSTEESQKLQEIVVLGMNLQDDFLRLKEGQDEQFLEVLTTYKQKIKDFIFENPRSMASYYALFQTVYDLHVFDVLDADDQILFSTVATSMNLFYPEGERTQHLCDYVLQAKAIQHRQSATQQLIDVAEEIKSPEIKMPDRNGKEIALSSLRGNVVILQFWMSEDQTSRTLNHQLKKLYSKYHSKGLEIYQVSLDGSKVLWEDALQTDNLTWTNVCDLLGANSSGALSYNVTEVPTNFILDRDGTMIGKNLFSSRLDEKMEELFK